MHNFPFQFWLLDNVEASNHQKYTNAFHTRFRSTIHFDNSIADFLLFLRM